MMYRILVVEDNLLNRELLQDWLETEGFAVATAASIDEAQAAMEEQLPDAILLDVQLGLEDGLSLAAMIRESPRYCGIPVIAVTAHAMVTDQQRVIQAGCNACVSKPIDFEVLREQLRIYTQDPSFKS
jgi:CheY-like chemotaxis protein